MTQGKIVIKYSEDAREGRVVPVIYGILRDNGLNVNFTTYYDVTNGIGITEFILKEKDLPNLHLKQKHLEGTINKLVRLHEIKFLLE